MSKACTPGTTATTDKSPLPNVAATLKQQRKTLRILAMGAAPGHVGARDGGYTELIETMLERTLKGIDVVMINRGVSGELAANAAARMKNEVALDEPDLVLWQVGTNDALAYVPADEFAATVKEQIDWLKAHKVDVVLVGLQFAKRMLRDAHYIDIRETLRELAAQENVIVIRFFEAMQIIDKAQDAAPEPVGGGIRARRGRLQLSGAIRGARHHARRLRQEHAEAAVALTADRSRASNKPKISAPNSLFSNEEFGIQGAAGRSRLAAGFAILQRDKLLLQCNNR